MKKASGKSKPINIFAVGTSRTVGGKVKTTLVFSTSKFQTGFAKGTTKISGKTSRSIVVGRAGKIRTKLPSGKPKATKITSFIGFEKGLSVGTARIKDTVRLLKKRKSLGDITIIRKNLEGLTQADIGRIASVRGKKFISPRIKFPSGKVVQKKAKINLDDFASVSGVFSSGDLSLIIGKSLTKKGAKANFIAVIKGTKKVSSLKGINQKQVGQALSKVISSTASALASASKTGAKGNRRIALARSIAIQSARIKKGAVIRKGAVLLRPTVTITKPQIVKIQSQVKAVQKTIKLDTQKLGSVTLQIKRSKIKNKQTQVQISKTKSKQKQKQLTKQKQTQEQKQRLLQKQAQIQGLRLRLKQAQIQKLRDRIFVPKLRLIKRPPIIPIKISTTTKILRKRKRRKAKGYNVFARPLKKRKGKRPKLIKFNKRVLTKQRARDYRNYLIDTSLSRTGSIRATKGEGSKGILRVPKGYSRKTTKKFRRFRQVKGKRKALRKGKVIERSGHLLDTRAERRKITLRRRIKELTPKKRRRKR